MEGPRVVLLIVILFFLLLSPDTKQPSPSQQKELGRRIEGLQQALCTLQNASYGDLDAAEHRWLNSTGLREDDGFNWRLLPLAQKAARIQLLQLFALFRVIILLISKFLLFLYKKILTSYLMVENSK